MADPIVHITGGIPDSGTGNITTLGQTLEDGANVTLGATTDAAATAGSTGTVNGHLRAISRDIVGGIVLQTGTNSIGAVTQSSAAALNATVVGTGTFAVQAAQSGTWNITNVSGTVSLPTGAATSAKQPALGTAGTASADVITVQGIASMTALKVDGTGGTFVASQGTASNLNATVVGTGTFAVQAAQSGTWNITNISGTISLPTGAANAVALGSTTSGQTGTLAVGAVTTAAPTYTNAQTNALSLTTAGSLRVDGVGGTFVASQSTASNLNATVVGTGTFAVQAAQSGTWNVANTGTFAVQAASAGDTASGSTDGGNPVKIGGVGKTANPAAVTDGQRVNGIFDKLGKQITVGAIRELKGVQLTPITDGNETTIVTAGTSGVFKDVYSLIISNSSATAVTVTIKDATAGTSRMVIYVPAGDTRGFTVPVDSAVPQAVAANNWTATVSTGVSTINVTALFVSNL